MDHSRTTIQPHPPHLPTQNAGDVDRTHCPSDEAVKAAAGQELPLSELFQQHLAQCPACLREFKDHRVQLEWERIYHKTKWLLYAVLFLILCSMAYRAYHASH